jgi:hypothetical protein
MKPKKLNRLNLINFIKGIQGIKESHKANGMYYIGNDKDEPDFQMQFIPQTNKYFFTIYLRGLKSEADNMHEEIYNFLQKLELNRNIVLDTESKTSLIN